MLAAIIYSWRDSRVGFCHIFLKVLLVIWKAPVRKVSSETDDKMVLNIVHRSGALSNFQNNLFPFSPTPLSLMPSAFLPSI